LYLPLYHAVEQGFFRDAGLEVDIITGGTATNSFASMLSGEADFALADPMYVPISREKGSQTKVVAQVVGRIAFWGLAKDPAISEINTNTLKGKTIATHPRPMSGYTYTIALIRMLALTPDGDVQIIESQPGTELAPLFNAQAAFVLTVEPNVSKAVAQGAHVVFSYPDALGDQILSALMTREDYITANRKLVLDVVSAIQRALTDIHHDIERALASARNRFPQLDEETLRQAVNRLVSERVIPTSISVSEDSWDRAIRVRIDAGDLRAPSPRSENCAVAIMEDGSKLHD
jgi:NitT/TauT family transport system substrate-binding protein